VNIGGKLVSVEMALLVQLIEFDKTLLNRAQDEAEALDQGLDLLPQRRIPIHIQQVCVSSMAVSQTHLNFGLIETGSDPKYLKFNLTNCAEVPLLYQIQMSGRFASGSISFRNHGDVGVVRPFWSKVLLRQIAVIRISIALMHSLRSLKCAWTPRLEEHFLRL
jgi:hypothetical protein